MAGRKSNTKVYLGLLVIAAIAAYAMNLGNIQNTLKAPAQASVTTTGATTTVTTSSGGGLKDGDLVTVNVNAIDALTGGSYTEATNTKSVWLYKSAAGTFTIQTTGTAKTIKTSADGKIWADFETQASGQTYIFSPVATRTTESTFNNDCTYMDVEGDGTKEYVCSFTTTGLTPQSANFGVIPTRNFNTAWYDESTATVSSPSDNSAVGTTAGTPSFITWSLTGTKGDALYISRLQLKLNSTTESLWSTGDMYVKFKDIGYTIPINDFRKWSDGTNTYFECIMQSDGSCGQTGYTIDKSYVLPFPVNGPGTSAIEVKNVVNLTGNVGLTETLYVDSVTELDGSNTQLSDAVKILVA